MADLLQTARRETILGMLPDHSVLVLQQRHRLLDCSFALERALKLMQAQEAKDRTVSVEALL